MAVEDKTFSFMCRIIKFTREPLIIYIVHYMAIYEFVVMIADIQTTSLLFIVVIAMPNNVRLQRVVRSKQKIL